MRSGRNLIRYGLWSVLGIALAASLGTYHRDVRGGESYHQFYKFPKGGARPVILKHGDDGILHGLVSPHSMGGTLGLTNTGGPVRVRLRLVGVPEGLTIHWENSHTRNFNLETKTVERILNRGDSISVHHTFYVGKNLRQRKVIFNGGLQILDDVRGTTLLTVPIRILNTGNVESPAKEESCHER